MIAIVNPPAITVTPTPNRVRAGATYTVAVDTQVVIAQPLIIEAGARVIVEAGASLVYVR